MRANEYRFIVTVEMDKAEDNDGIMTRKDRIEIERELNRALEGLGYAGSVRYSVN